MNTTFHSHKQGLLNVYTNIYSHLTWYVLFLPPQKEYNVKQGSINLTYMHSHCFPRICTTMRPNVILRGSCNYKYILRYPLHWKNPSSMVMGKFLSFRAHPNPILLPTFHNPNSNNNNRDNPPYNASFNRIIKPNRNNRKYG
jgi:hypothetical protein